jgi:hypothetical protein
MTRAGHIQTLYEAIESLPEGIVCEIGRRDDVSQRVG